MIRAIIFDIGGVVLIPKTFHPLAGEYAGMMGLKEEEVYGVLVKYWRMWKLEKIKESEFFENLTRDLKVETDKNRLREMMYSVPKMDEDVLSLTKKLRRRYEIFALTNHVREFFEFLDRRHGLEGMFSRIFKSYETKLAKPDPRFYEYVLKEIGRKAEECVFIDDREDNIRSAKELGIRAILHENAERTVKELRKLGVIF